MKKHHEIREITFDKYFVYFNCDGIDYKTDLRKQSKKLSECSIEIKSVFEVSPSGYGIHWPMIDEDLSIDGLIKHASAVIKANRKVLRNRSMTHA